MIRSKLMKITALAMSLSMLLAIPAYAGNQQSGQNSWNTNNGMFPFQQDGTQLQNGQNGQNGMQNNQNSQNGMQNNQNGQNGMQNSQNTQNNNKLSNAAQFLVSKGIIKGNSSGNYAMTDNVKRCDMSLMLVRAFDLNTESTDSTNFGDVTKDSYYYDAVNTMKQMGIARGDGQNFNPSQNMTLQEAILFVERALDAAGIDYTDVDLEGLFDGKSLTDYATREDVSAILYAVLGEDYQEAPTAVTNAAIVSYQTDANSAVAFDGDDFNDVCSDVTGGTLDYVVFTNPSGQQGRLYYGYTSSSDFDAKVSSSDKYYLDSDDGNTISDVSYVPASNISGPVTINYTGYNTDGTSFHGTVRITVEAEEQAVADAISYTTGEDTALAFDEDDFNEACEDATGESLSYVKFVLPSTTYGKLYYGYDSEDDYDGKVSTTSKYYYDSDDYTSISDVTFVPTDGYTGTVKIGYTGLNADGETFTGTIKITVE